jgi:hypothetical protein
MGQRLNREAHPRDTEKVGKKTKKNEKKNKKLGKCGIYGVNAMVNIAKSSSQS